MTERWNYIAASPRGMQAFGGIHLYIEKSGLPSPLVKLVYLRVSQINGCAYCISTHSRHLIDEGVSVHKLLMLSVWRESLDLFSHRERAALQWAEALAEIAQTHASDSDYQVVRAEFNDKQLADFTFAIALVNAYNRIGIGFRQATEHSLLEFASGGRH